MFISGVQPFVGSLCIVRTVHVKRDHSSTVHRNLPDAVLKLGTPGDNTLLARTSPPLASDSPVEGLGTDRNTHTRQAKRGKQERQAQPSQRQRVARGQNVCGTSHHGGMGCDFPLGAAGPGFI
jgi:hypothetical protein